MRRNGAAIYLESFATNPRRGPIWPALPPTRRRVAVPHVHAPVWSAWKKHVQSFSEIWAARLRGRRWQTARPILCDAHMVSEGITRTRFARPTTKNHLHPARPRVPTWRSRWANTRLCRSAGNCGGRIWRGFGGHRLQRADGAVYLLQYCSKTPTCPRPAPSSCPVGLSVRLKSKDALMQDLPVPSMNCAGAFGRFCD